MGIRNSKKLLLYDSIADLHAPDYVPNKPSLVFSCGSFVDRPIAYCIKVDQM